MSAEFDVRIDYYEVLQVHPRAEVAVIRSAFRTILRDLQSHPDLGGSHEQAVLINEAYRILSDECLRQKYDRARRELALDDQPKPKRSAIPESEWRYVVCPACQSRNRVLQMPGPARVLCGACGAPLDAPVRGESAPAQPAATNTLRLSRILYETLRARGELVLRQDSVPRGSKITCRRCRRIWTATTNCVAPHACPACGATDWKSFRLFKCRLCGEEFTSTSLSRNAYLLFANCPRCGKPHWHNGIENGPASALRRLLSK